MFLCQREAKISCFSPVLFSDILTGAWFFICIQIHNMFMKKKEPMWENAKSARNPLVTWKAVLAVLCLNG